MSIWTDKKLIQKYEHMRKLVEKNPTIKTRFIIEKALSVGEIDKEERLQLLGLVREKAISDK